MAHLLLVEDDPAITVGLQDALESEGFEVTIERDGEGGLKAAQRGEYDCMILDLMLPLMNGRDVCRQLRAEHNNIPILILTSKGEESDIVLGLEIGADDYVTKPFSVAELVARIRALLRRRQVLQEESTQTLDFGNVHVDYNRMECTVDGKNVHMSVRELEVLRFLASNEGTIVTRDMLLDKVWGYDSFPTTRTVDNYILSLRKKLEHDPARPKHILTVHSKGYRFTLAPKAEGEE